MSVKWFLVWLLGGWMLVIALACLMFLLVRGRLRRHHRVDPKVATGAPIRWMIDPRSPGRLHRRLSRVGALATAVAEENQPRPGLGRAVAQTVTRPFGRRPDPHPSPPPRRIFGPRRSPPTDSWPGSPRWHPRPATYRWPNWSAARRASRPPPPG